MTSIEDQLILHEGLRLRVYRCPAGKLTIGVGRNLDAVGIRPGETQALGLTKASAIAQGITKPQAMALLASDLDEARRCLDHLVDGWRDADRVRRKVLEDLAFNMGQSTLAKFKDMLAAVRRHDWITAAAHLKASAWFGQVGERGPRLVGMFRTGIDYA